MSAQPAKPKRPPKFPAAEHFAFSVTEAAELVGISRYTLYEFIREGALPVFRLAPKGDLRITADDLKAWVEKNRAVNAQAAAP
jgi:excisionase family DNA binding protein